MAYNFGLENSTCVVDMCFYVPNLGGSVVSDCGDTRTARCAPGNVLGVGDTEQTFSCQPDDVVTGTQPACEALPLSAPNIDSEFVVDLCIDRAEEGSCLVSGARGSPIERDPSVCTCVTNDSLIDDGLTTGELPTGAPDPWWLNPVGYRARLRQWWFRGQWWKRERLWCI